MLSGLQVLRLVSATGPLVFLGVITSPSGHLSLPFSLPAVPLGMEGLRVFAQGVFLGADGLTLGSGSAMAWVDESL